MGTHAGKGRQIVLQAAWALLARQTPTPGCWALWHWQSRPPGKQGTKSLPAVALPDSCEFRSFEWRNFKACCSGHSSPAHPCWVGSDPKCCACFPWLQLQQHTNSSNNKDQKVGGPDFSGDVCFKHLQSAPH